VIDVALSVIESPIISMAIEDDHAKDTAQQHRNYDG
jgi:hypothetical protein